MQKRSSWQRLFLRRKWLTPRQWHFLVMLALVYMAANLQTFFFARAANPWLHVDLVSIIVVYFSIEHFFFAAFLRVSLSALILQATSLAPAGFFLMYFWIALIIANFMARYVVLHNVINQLAIFASIFLVKFVLVYFVASKLGQPAHMMDFISHNLPEFLSTVFMAAPVFAILARLDSTFEFAATRDRRAELVEGF